MFFLTNKHTRLIILHISILFIIFLSCACTQPVFSQADKTPADNEAGKKAESAVTKIQSGIEVIDSKISQLESLELAKPKPDKPEIISGAKEFSELDLLRELKNQYLRQITGIQRKEALLKSDSDLDKMIAIFKSTGIVEKPPYTIKLFDSMHDQLEAEKSKQDTLKLALETSQKELDDAQSYLKKEEKSYREVKDSIDKSNADDLQKLNIAELKKTIVKNMYLYKEIQLEVSRLDLKNNQKTIGFLKNKINAIKKHIRFTQEELSERIVEIDKKSSEINRQLHQAKIKLSANEARLADARESLKKARGEEEITRQQDILDTNEAWVQASADQVEMLEEILTNLSIQKELWNRRYSIFNNSKTVEYSKWKQEVTIILDNSRRNRQVIEARLIDLETNITNLKKKIDAWDKSYGNKSNAESKLRALEKNKEIFSQRLSEIISLIRIAELLDFQIQEELQHVTMKDVLQWIYSAVTNLWKLELFVIGELPITMGKVLRALILILVGIYFAKKFTQLIKKEFIIHTRIDESAGKALEKIMYYFLILMIGLFTLHVLNIPLTIFTFLGGAIAIAIGFGAQNLLNNFISGLIIMFERPIKIGDIIQYDNNYGRVIDIGTRCTLIKLFSGIDILVPNSSIIEKAVTNLTFSDNNIQQSITVGVTYGSPTKEVEKILYQTVSSDTRVLKVPEPIVLFTDFGESSLNFEVLFWIQISRLVDSKIVRSDLRFKIDEAFRESNITIAFPQKEIHLNTSKPIQIKMTD